jgi:hypothetical protein
MDQNMSLSNYLAGYIPTHRGMLPAAFFSQCLGCLSIGDVSSLNVQASQVALQQAAVRINGDSRGD